MLSAQVAGFNISVGCCVWPGLRRDSPVLSKGLVFHRSSFRVHLLVFFVLHCRKKTSTSKTLGRRLNVNLSACVCTSSCVHERVVFVVPAYLPPLLRLMRQRMSRISSSSTMALMSPINQPWVANPPGISDGTEHRSKTDWRKYQKILHNDFHSGAAGL